MLPSRQCVNWIGEEVTVCLYCVCGTYNMDTYKCIDTQYTCAYTHACTYRHTAHAYACTTHKHACAYAFLLLNVYHLVVADGYAIVFFICDL